MDYNFCFDTFMKEKEAYDCHEELHYKIVGNDLDDMDYTEEIGSCYVTIIEDMEGFLAQEEIDLGVYTALCSVNYSDDEEGIKKFWKEVSQTGIWGGIDLEHHRDEGFYVTGKLAVIDLIYIEKYARGAGVGTYTLKKIVEDLKEKESVDFIILQPYPVDLNKYEEIDKERKINVGIGKLALYYKRFGFIQTNGNAKDEKNKTIAHFLKRCTY